MNPESLRITLKQLFAALPDDLKRREAAATELLRLFRSEAASYLLPAIRDALAHPPASFEEKQMVAARINALLHDHGLALSHSAVSTCCGVTATRNVPGAEAGHLRLAQRKRSSEGRNVRSSPTTNLNLSELQLVEAPIEVPGPRPLGRA